MWLFKQSSSVVRAALIYITVGALVVIWTVVWDIYLHNNPPETNSVYYWCSGFLVTGMALVLIGLGLAWLGRSARRADIPPEGVTLATANPQPIAVAPALVMAPANSTAALVAPDGQVVVSPLPGTGLTPASRGVLPRNL